MISISFQDPYCSHAFALSIHPLVSMSILVLFGRSRSLLQFPSSPRLSRSLHPTIRRIPHSFIAPTLSIPSVPYGNGKKHQHLLFPSRLPHVSAVLMAQFMTRLLPMFNVIPDGLTPRSHLIGHTPSSVAPPPPLLPQSAGDLEVPARNTAVMPHVGGATRNQVQGEADLRASGLNSDSQLLLSVFGCHSCYTKRIRAA